MNKRQTRLFAGAATAVSALVFLVLTIDSHRQFGKLTNADNITPAVSRGKDIWHAKNCINCHTLFGEGAYYAPDLTKITQLRGNTYLEAFLRDPSKFYDEAKYRRVMPAQNLSDTEILDLIAFLDWVSKVDNQGWPPRPILVAGATIPGTDRTVAQQQSVAATSNTQAATAGSVSTADDPVALGQALFNSVSPSCNACHSIAPGVNMVGPSLAGVSARAQQIISSHAYKGQAKDVAGYIRESIHDPSAYVVTGASYSANGISFMPNTYGQSLKPEQLDYLAAYLGSLK
ncbi:cytochrome c [Uliginosibacterium sp. 31-16]|uniref:c-type cytochrome n=1 Tax=Uliginosibacterium sp. 31-16 TaxID=3068315 RepID=UPI00273E0892|nr:cytochrome c [Uliginosibacterium sp. 31-16]MDP5240932.1 cytochrome c [Uliginosibacterium sp. 31-16]